LQPAVVSSLVAVNALPSRSVDTHCGDGAPIITRPRLIEHLSQRWSRRVTSIVAGPGFGKSILLAQAMRENEVAPRGDDVLIECTTADRSSQHFLERVAMGISALGCARPAEHLCVIVDDVDHAVSSPGGSRALLHLIEVVPANIHFVLVGRCPVRGLAHLRAAGEVLELGDGELAFSDDEAAEFAAARDLDAARLAVTGGWPAVASVAATRGITGVIAFLWESVLDHLTADERTVLAIALTIGPCDAALLAAATGRDPAEVVEIVRRVPLVGGIDHDQIVVHEVWARAVDEMLTVEGRLAAVGCAIHELITRRDHVAAFRLCAQHGLWSDAARVINASCDRGFLDVSPSELHAWLQRLPFDRWETPEGLLLRGLVGCFHDAFRASTLDCLERAGAAFRQVGHVGSEIAAISALAYVSRNQGNSDALPAMIRRVVELDALGDRTVAGLMALVRSFIAEFAGDDRLMLEETARAPSGSLSSQWQAVIAFRQVTGHLTLGNEQPMLAAAMRCAELAGDTNLRHALPLAHWFAGDPRPALDALDVIVDDAHRTTIDSVALGSFATMVFATAGRVGDACAQLEFVERAAAGGSLLPLMQGYLVGIRTMVAVARGDDDAARAIAAESLAAHPLADVQGWRMTSRWLAFAYVLVPGVRAELDRRDVAPIHRRRIAVARAVAAALEDDDIAVCDLADVSPGLVATTLPLRWAMTLAAWLTDGGASLGADVVEHLFELHGARARDALRAVADSAHARRAKAARKLLSAIALTPSHHVRLAVLGPTRLEVDGVECRDLGWRRERVRTLLVFLMVNGPSRREQITDALWPDLDPDAADRNLRVTLSYLHRVLEPDRRTGEPPFVVRDVGSNLVLAGPPHVVRDIDEFDAAIETAEELERRGMPSWALQEYERALSLWHGDCLGDVAYEDWAEVHRGAINDRLVRAAVRAGELSLACRNTSAARRHAHKALAANQWSEAAHRVVINAALADDDRCLAAMAMAACDAMLDDLGVTAGEATEAVRRRIADSVA